MSMSNRTNIIGDMCFEKSHVNDARDVHLAIFMYRTKSFNIMYGFRIKHNEQVVKSDCFTGDISLAYTSDLQIVLSDVRKIMINEYEVDEKVFEEISVEFLYLDA